MNPLFVLIFKYVLLPILMLVGMFVMSKLKKVKSLINNKRLIIFTILFGSISIIPVVFLGLFENDFYPYMLLSSYVWYIFYGFLFALWFTNTTWYESIGLNNDNIVLFTFAILLSLCFGSWLHYIIFERLNTLNYQLLASCGIFCIAIPIVYKVSEDAFLRIPLPIYKLWYPEHDSDHLYWETLDSRRFKQISVEFRRSPVDSKSVSIDVKIPPEVYMGQWFHRFIEDHDATFPETPIVLDHDGELYGWGLYQRKWFGLITKPIDFDKLTDELHLKHKSVIIAKRVASS